VRPEKLFTANETLIRLKIGRLGNAKHERVVKSVIAALIDGLDGFEKLRSEI